MNISPTIFQRILLNIVRKHSFSGFDIVNVDDILIFSRTLELAGKKLLEAVSEEAVCSEMYLRLKILLNIIENRTVRSIEDTLKAIEDYFQTQIKEKYSSILGEN